MTDRELMQQALEALQAYGAHTPNCDHLMLLLSLPPQRKPCSCGLVATMQALRERLAQPEQEPVAWWNDIGTHIDLNVSGRGTPLYTTPPQRKPWVGLTDEEKAEIWSNNETAMVVTATEAKLKEKNT